MDETTILLVPAPGAKPEFLATVEPLRSDPNDGGGDLPFEIILDGYTRDQWAVQSSQPPQQQQPPSSSSEPCWGGAWLKSVDGRGKLPGFLKYLKERKKVPYGRFEPTTSTADDTGGGGSEAEAEAAKGVLLVPFEQPVPPEDLLGATSADDVLFCRYVLDERRIQGGYRRPGQPQRRQQQQQQRGAAAAKSANAAPKPPPQQQPAKSSRSSSGVLGNLLGASRRTNQKLDIVPTRKKPSADLEAGGGGAGGAGAPTSGSGAVVAKFRQDVEQKLLDFKSDAGQTCLKIPISLGHVIRDLPSDQVGGYTSVTMDVLKYVVYEQAEEVGEDKWVAAKEPSEFLDEVVVAVYKEGCAPEEVLEDLNKGELPDEIVQQQKAMRGARMKELARMEGKHDKLVESQTVKRGGPEMDFTTLNTEKRDRRTIEEIQRDLLSGGGGGADDGNNNKRQRTD